MNSDLLKSIFDKTAIHRAEHLCGGYPYEHADVLMALVLGTKSLRILELGTAFGYTAACMASVGRDVHIDTIDRDEEHMAQAETNWHDLGISSQITPYLLKAEEILPKLTETYDFIFFDGYVPSLKFLIHFERLLKTNGMLVTANLFLRDASGGKYVRELKKSKRWKTGIFADTAISVKLF